MRDNIGLNDRQAKFVKLVAAGEVSVTEAYVLAGYGTKRDSSNANKLKRSLEEFIAAERIKLGLPPIGEEEPGEVDNAAVAEILTLQRKLYADAVEAGNLPIQRAALREITKLMKRPGKPGRPANNTTPASKPAPSANHFANFTSEQIWDIAFDLTESEEDFAAYEADVELWKEYESQREAWINDRPNSFMQTPFPGVAIRTLPGGTQVIDFEPADERPEPTLASELKSSTSHVALEAGEIVRRL